MKAYVIGKKLSKWTNDKGVEQESAKVFVTHKVPHDSDFTSYEGIGCSEVSVPISYYNDFVIDNQYLLDFDKNGKLLDIEEL